MENHIIYSKTEDEFVIIAHACPGKTGEFQWYLVDDPNETKEEVLEGWIYESITLSNTTIKELYEGKWLCCHCKVDGDIYDEGCLYLTDSFLDMIRENQFDNVAFFDKNGMIRGSQYVKKEEKELGTGCLNYSLGVDENAPYCKEEERESTRNPEYLYECTFDFWWNGWNYNLEVQMPVKYGTIEAAKQDKSSCRFEKRDGHVVLVIYSGWEQGMKDGKWYEHVAGEELAVYRWEDWHLWKMTNAKEKELSGMIDAIQDYLPYAENWDVLFGVDELPEGWGLTPESLAYRIISYVN